MGIIKGKIQRGLGESKNTVREQMPFFRECFPEVSKCKEGTINILLEKPLVILTPDFTSQPLPWHPAFKVVKGGEVFKFVRINITVEGCKPVKAWIYKAQFSPYHDNPFYIEVIAPPIGFSGEPGCSIEILSRCSEGFVVVDDSERPSASA
ncbi:MAG: Glycosyltransferase family 9 protein [uncultured bacterium]|nr:MAG: Glycosyltransferase family 9 protein [uncultured bacterium]